MPRGWLYDIPLAKHYQGREVITRSLDIRRCRYIMLIMSLPAILRWRGTDVHLTPCNVTQQTYSKEKSTNAPLKLKQTSAR